MMEVRCHVKWPLVSPPCLNCWEHIRASISSQMVEGSQQWSNLSEDILVLMYSQQLRQGGHLTRHLTDDSDKSTLISFRSYHFSRAAVSLQGAPDNHQFWGPLPFWTLFQSMSPNHLIPPPHTHTHQKLIGFRSLQNTLFFGVIFSSSVILLY